jgi:tetratricopeptide (TPR) repeat protein
VRVTGQLINARTDEHVWAKSYDRDLTDIFSIQSELSQAIAAALSAVILPQEKTLVENRPTTNLAAYDLYLKARAWAQGYGNEASRTQVEKWLQEAVQLDPAFAEAWALLGTVHAMAVRRGEDNSPERIALATAAIETAVRLAPDDPVVIEYHGSYYSQCFHDYARAAEQYQRLLILRPNSADAYAELTLLARRQGHWADALAFMQKSVQIDPRNPSSWSTMGDLLWAAHRYDEAVPYYRRAAELAPDDLESAFSAPLASFYARGSTLEVDAWFASVKTATANASGLLLFRQSWARIHGDFAQAVRIDREHPYIDSDDDPQWWQDTKAVMDLVGQNELAAARARAKELIPELDALLEKQGSNARLWQCTAFLYALESDRESALRCARRMKELRSESFDAKDGPGVSIAFAQVLAWTGDIDGALVELGRLLRTPNGANVYSARFSPGWLPLYGDKRFEALLNDPKNNAPLF